MLHRGSKLLQYPDILKGNMMYSGRRNLLKLLMILLVFAFSASLLEAQTLKYLNKKRRELEEKMAGSPEYKPTTPEIVIPLEGKIDRSSYYLGPGDEMDVSIWGAEFYESFHLFVSAEGRLLVPPVGPLEVDGMSLDEAESYLTRQISKYYSEARISLTLINPRTFRVFAVGAIKKPGIYFMTAVDRVGGLLVEAEGIRSGGSQRRVRLLDRDRHLIKTVDMIRYRMQGTLEENPTLVDGCIVEVPPVENYVILRGSFTNLSGSDSVTVGRWLRDQISEFVVEYLPGETLEDLLELVGGPGNIQTVAEGRIIVGDSLRNSKRWVPLTEQMAAAPLEHGTIYEYPVRNDWISISGSVSFPGRYLYQPGWTVRDYLGQAGGPNSQGSGTRCYIKRVDGSNDKAKFDDTVLPGDILYVPQKFRFYEWSPVVTLITAILFIVYK